MGLKIKRLKNHGDSRGACFTIQEDSLKFLKMVKDVHVAQILPGAMRGNHYHKKRRELIFVQYDDTWILGWSQGNSIRNKTYKGKGFLVLEVLPNSSHAIRNCGKKPLNIIGFSDQKFSQKRPDSYEKTVL